MDVTHGIEGVLPAVRRLIAERGLGGATMERIAEAAGVSRMTLHRRGYTRERLVEALRAQFVAEERDALVDALLADGTARDRLELALEALCRVSEDNLELLGRLSDSVRDAVYHEPGEGALTREEFVAPLRRLLMDGARDGSLRTQDDPGEVATVLYNQIGWTYRHLRVGHRFSPERARTVIVRLALDGVGA